jgi:hypothetical protein
VLLRNGRDGGGDKVRMRISAVAFVFYGLLRTLRRRDRWRLVHLELLRLGDGR